MPRKSIAQLEAERARIDEQLKAARKRASAKEKKQRDHALIVMGAWLESSCGGDWTAINYRELAHRLAGLGNVGEDGKTSWQKAGVLGAKKTPEEATRELRAVCDAQKSKSAE